MAWNYGGYGGYNPANTYIPQMAPQMPVQAPQSVPNNGQGLSPASRMVSNRDEANAVPADFSGSLMVFPDIRNNRVYIKRWNFQTGTADFIEFGPVVNEPAKEAPAVQYATMDDLKALRDELMNTRKAVSKNDSDE